MCLYPKLIKNRKYLSNKKNGGNVPPVPDERVKLVPVGCGKCMECMKQKKREWMVRLLEDIKEHKNGKFVTLTFSTESLRKLINMPASKRYESLKGLKGYDLDNGIAKRAVRLFLERWRKKYKKSLRHWLVTELGHKGTEHLHLHGIVWTDVPLATLEEIWGYGFVWKGKEENLKIVNYVNKETVGYITKYITKTDIKHKLYKPKIFTSPGIGSNYKNKHDFNNNKFKGKDTREYYRTTSGHKINLPIYWRNKVYSEEEREKLWLMKLDKGERWVMGERVKNETEYFKLLEYYREINKSMGFGDDNKNWELEQYERELRWLKQKERLYKNNNKKE